MADIAAVLYKENEMNEVKIAGTIQKDPTIRYTSTNLCWAQFTTVVETEGKKARAYVPCKAFGDVAEELEKFGKKDMFITLEGRIATGSYTAKDGHKVYTVDVVAEKIDYSKGLHPSVEDKAAEQVALGFESLSEAFPF